MSVTTVIGHVVANKKVCFMNLTSALGEMKLMGDISLAAASTDERRFGTIEGKIFFSIRFSPAITPVTLCKK